MLRRFLPPTLLLAVVWASPLRGQAPDVIVRILAAIDLPVSAAEARNEGIPSEEIRKVLEILIGASVPAGEARDVIDEERAARRQHGPVDNFGAFVQSQLRAGLRGRELAAAIRAEHAARGKGGTKGVAEGRGRGKAGAVDEHVRGHGAQGMKGGGRPETGPAADAGKRNGKRKPAARPAPPLR